MNNEHEPEMVEIQEKYVRCKRCNRYYPEDCAHLCPPETTRPPKETWKKQFADTYYIARLGGKAPDPAGALEEAFKFIDSLLDEAREEGYRQHINRQHNINRQHINEWRKKNHDKVKKYNHEYYMRVTKEKRKLTSTK
jgi:hypothetical protein